MVKIRFNLIYKYSGRLASLYIKKNVNLISINLKPIFEHFEIKQKTQGGAVADSFGLMLCFFM